MQPHQTRVIEEKTELDEKIGKLSEFIDKNDFYKALPGDEQGRLTEQLSIMRLYSKVLGARIAAFEPS